MEAALEQLREIPGVGRVLARALWDLGFSSPEELRGQNPEDLYLRLFARRGEEIDRCVLYVFRCAVYYASASDHDPELLKWWNWKGREEPNNSGRA
jgi:hypothetical protein